MGWRVSASRHCILVFFRIFVKRTTAVRAGIATDIPTNHPGADTSIGPKNPEKIMIETILTFSRKYLWSSLLFANINVARRINAKISIVSRKTIEIEKGRR